MSPMSIGGHSAIDLLNTSFAPNGAPVELIGDGKAFIGWLRETGMLSAEQANRLARKLGAKGLEGLAAEARKLREWARAWLARWRSAGRATARARDAKRASRAGAAPLP